MQDKKKKQQKTEEEIKAEIKRLADRANDSSVKQSNLFMESNLGDEDISFSFDSTILNDTADPIKSHKLYYGIQRLLKDYLPQGKENEKLRKKIYAEKNLFLNRGIDIKPSGIRGSDGRMTYITNFLEVAFDLVAKWVASGANAYDIWQSFWDLNEEKEYHNKNSEG